MADEQDRTPVRGPGKFLGSLREALAAASKDETNRPAAASDGAAHPASAAAISAAAPPLGLPSPATASRDDADATILIRKERAVPSAAEAARTARAGLPNIPPMEKHVEFQSPPTTRVVRVQSQSEPPDAGGRTQLLRGKQVVKRGRFHQDPVVGWLVVVGGLGLGSFRAIYEGNNTIGRASSQRIPIDFGDDAISSEEQAYIRYDSSDRTFLFVPNLAKTNVVSVNDKRPTAAVPLAAMDVITMGRTQLVFVPFCGPEFDWSELPDIKD
jgi:FHA domain